MLSFMPAIIAAAIVATGRAEAPTQSRDFAWCSSPQPFVREFKHRPDVRIQHLSRHAVATAKRKLARRSIVSVDRNTYLSLVQSGLGVPDKRHLYLVRGGVMAPPNLSDRELYEHARLASYSAYEGSQPHTIQIVSLITSEKPQQSRNVPVLISTSSGFTKASAACLGGR